MRNEIDIEASLWLAASRVRPDYVRGSYDCWVLCPRAHAVKHLRCIIELEEAFSGLESPIAVAKRLLVKVGRFFDGDDLVFAVGDAQ